MTFFCRDTRSIPVWGVFFLKKYVSRRRPVNEPWPVDPYTHTHQCLRAQLSRRERYGSVLVKTCTDWARLVPEPIRPILGVSAPVPVRQSQRQRWNRRKLHAASGRNAACSASLLAAPTNLLGRNACKCSCLASGGNFSSTCYLSQLTTIWWFLVRG